MATVCAVITNLMTWAYSKRGTKYTAMDFMPDWDIDAPVEVKKQSMEEMKKMLLGIAGTQNKMLGMKPKKPPKSKNNGHRNIDSDNSN